jgi:hypothetical protein
MKVCSCPKIGKKEILEKFCLELIPVINLAGHSLPVHQLISFYQSSIYCQNVAQSSFSILIQFQHFH